LASGKNSTRIKTDTFSPLHAHNGKRFLAVYTAG
jgi:hypothetical protein